MTQTEKLRGRLKQTIEWLIGEQSKVAEDEILQACKEAGLKFAVPCIPKDGRMPHLEIKEIEL